jgi:hypothetical protein
VRCKVGHHRRDQEHQKIGAHLAGIALEKVADH